MKITMRWNTFIHMVDDEAPIFYSKIEKVFDGSIYVYTPYNFVYGDRMVGIHFITPWIEEHFNKCPILMEFYI